MVTKFKESDVLLKVRDLKIQGYTDETWVDIIKGVDLTLHRGEVMGLIGESGAGKSTIGAACMGYARDGTRISDGSRSRAQIHACARWPAPLLVVTRQRGSDGSNTAHTLQ